MTNIFALHPLYLSMFSSAVMLNIDVVLMEQLQLSGCTDSFNSKVIESRQKLYINLIRRL